MNNNALTISIKRLLSASLTLATLLLAACESSENDAVATGIFEATETSVSAEQSGKLVMFNVTEGQRLSQGQEVGLVDTVPFAIKLVQTDAAGLVYTAQKPDVAAQIASLEQQLAKARQEQKRYTELVADGAAPRKQLDDATSEVRVLDKQLVALRSQLDTQTNSLDKQKAANDVEAQYLREQIAKCHIAAPQAGTVLEKYAEPGEVVAAGKALFLLADLDNMFLRAYVTSEQLAEIKVGQKVQIASDYGNGKGKEFEGTISWISQKSEFTPKTILTNDERADLVYAVKIAVKNDGSLKIGMYGKVKSF